MSSRNNILMKFLNRKRKADASPLKNDRIKRSALTNLTNNNVVKNDLEEHNAKKLKIFENKDENKPGIQPVSYRTRGAAAAAAANTTTTVLPVQKNQVKVNKKTKVLVDIENVLSQEKESKKTVGVNAITVLKSKQDVSGKSSIASRRISNEFEKTEESLYVSALEDIPSDVSRLSDVRSKPEVKSLSSTSSSDSLSGATSSQLSNLSSATLSSSDGDEVFDEPPSRRLPQGVQHFDRENWNDPHQVSHYAMNIFEYLRHQEDKYQIKDYMSNQPELSKWMRSLLIDWMVEVQESTYI